MNNKNLDIFFDVGADKGQFTEFIISKNPNAKVFIVDPLTDRLERFKNNSNLKIVNKVITNKHLAGTVIDYFKYTNSELSSLLKIKEDSEIDIVWRNHKEGFDNFEKMKVQTETLKNIIDKNFITNISFLKIDAQGEDLNVILSSGDRIGIINSFVIEVAYEDTLSLYENEEKYQETINKLFDSGFIPVRIVPNGGGECNIFFYNKNFGLEKYFELERKYDFRNAPTLKLNHFSVYGSNVTMRDLLSGLKKFLFLKFKKSTPYVY